MTGTKSCAAGRVDATEHHLALQRSIALEWVTVVFFAVEAGTALVLSSGARSVVLGALALDSVIELVRGSVLLAHLRRDEQGPIPERLARIESGTATVTAVALVTLCVYVAVLSVVSLGTAAHEENSVLALAVAAVGAVVMPVLAVQKARAAERLDSPALRRDAACTLTAGMLAAAAVVSLLLDGYLDWIWVDGVLGLAVLPRLVHEASGAVASARRGA